MNQFRSYCLTSSSEVNRLPLRAFLGDQKWRIVEINEKLASGNRCLRALNKIITSRYISNEIKIRLYKTLIKPIVVGLYGSESWTLTEKAIAHVSTRERKILRKIYGPTRENGVWRIELTGNCKLYTMI